MEQEDLRRRQIQALMNRFERAHLCKKAMVPMAVKEPDIPGRTFLRYNQSRNADNGNNVTSGVIYIPYCQREMLPKLLVYLMPFYVHGDTVLTLHSDWKHWALIKVRVQRMK